MPTKDFQLNGRKYVNGGRKLLNGSPVRQWAEYKPGDNCWVYNGIVFASVSATRLQIAARFQDN